jgi:DNA-binding NarL/FixJ family response regulator
MLKGMPNNKIGSELCITEATVKTHLQHIYEKYGTKNRVETLIYILCRDTLNII